VHVRGCSLFFFFLIRRPHSISFTRARGIPKHRIGFGRILPRAVRVQVPHWDLTYRSGGDAALQSFAADVGGVLRVMHATGVLRPDWAKHVFVPVDL
jgi:hypothetical protein